MSDTKKAIHFGAGNIGRGFVGEFLHESGYEVVFVDVMDQVIEALQKTPSYTVTEISEDGERKLKIENYRAINSKTHMDDVIREISTAAVVTCAVGPNILPRIAPAIAAGIDQRKPEDYSRPLSVIACENAIGATDTLHKYILEKTPESRKQSLPERARFANSAIDRIVPAQAPNSGLNVKIEKYYEWVVEQKPFGEFGHPDIPAIHWVDDLEPYIERKLFTVNTGHATAAYFGYVRGKKWVHESLADPEIRQRVHAALKETASLITAKHNISAEEQQKYVDAIIARISNPALEDHVVRVGRAPLRKVSRKERFINPAAQLAEMGKPFDALLNAFEQALHFQDVEGDEESIQLGALLKKFNAEELTGKLTGLPRDHPLFEPVTQHIRKVQVQSRDSGFFDVTAA
ncbi:mannitol-1-phosphate dehydrogenase [Ascosphaera apis ARSEF 7405]|uniref:Mannitol-1-phosphate 5-dehydrogenase n=1 Tax=Ascosphaera apis ARSEF 7405 TaxID=392613 RepID=A0A167VHJ1_9EURO|nr:mannitol-1-phosphate dehydrogenase [Ascosphaera apis ARSEF 7405]